MIPLAFSPRREEREEDGINNGGSDEERGSKRREGEEKKKMLRELLHHFQLPSFPLDTNEKMVGYISPPLGLLYLCLWKYFLQDHVRPLLSSFVTCEPHLSSFCFAV